MVSSSKRRQVEIKDIFTWTEAFTIFKMVLSAVHLHRWRCLSKYKLLIIQTACYFSGSAWLEYDLVFRKHAAAFGTVTGLDELGPIQFSLHLLPPLPQSSSSMASAPSSIASCDISLVPPFCYSWNDGQWPFGRCKYRHRRSNCEDDHTQITCPFPNPFSARSRSPPLGGRGGRY